LTDSDWNHKRMRTSAQQELLHWCRRRESNSRPRDYETLALPLSYAGTAGPFMLRKVCTTVKDRGLPRNRCDHNPRNPRPTNSQYASGNPNVSGRSRMIFGGSIRTQCRARRKWRALQRDSKSAFLLRFVSKIEIDFNAFSTAFSPLKMLNLQPKSPKIRIDSSRKSRNSALACVL
jgi:hypothetical protein